MRRRLLWETALGFVGFFACLSLVQAIINLFRPEPALWPGFVAGAFVLATWLIWRAKP